MGIFEQDRLYKTMSNAIAEYMQMYNSDGSDVISIVEEIAENLGEDYDE